jgi:ribose transport system substrate-binding protein
MRIVYFLPDITNPFWREVVSGVEKRASSEGMSLEVVSSDHDGTKQLAQLLAYTSHAPDALLVSPIETKGVSIACRAIHSSGMPVVSIDLNLSPNVTASIISGNMQGGLLAATHLADRAGVGARVVHIKAEEHLQNVQLRSSSFVGEAARRGLKIVDTIQADSSREIARSRMAELLAKGARFDALFAENDNMAIGAIAAIEEAKLSPHPMIVGYDGTMDAQDLMRSGKMEASVAQDASTMGQKAVEALIDAKKGNPVRVVVTVLPHLLTAAELK